MCGLKTEFLTSFHVITKAAGPYTIGNGSQRDVSFLYFSTNVRSETGPGSLLWNSLHCVFSLTLPSLHLPQLKADEN